MCYTERGPCARLLAGVEGSASVTGERLPGSSSPGRQQREGAEIRHGEECVITPPHRLQFH